MPELPDVEGYRSMLSEYLPGTSVRDVQVIDAGVLRNTSAAAFRDQLLGCRFRTPRRRGKWLMLPTDGPTLLIHNGMTGRLYFAEAGSSSAAESDRNDRLIISTDAGEFCYADLRKLRGVWIVDTEAGIAAVVGEQGPDALGISAGAFRAALRGRRGVLKAVLMNQRVLAGLGNMLSDEICWRARLHPARPASTLGEDDLRRLHRVTQRTLSAAVRKGGIPRTRGWLASARDRAAMLCPRCRTTLCHTRIGGRSSIWCPRCQPASVSSRG